MNTDKWKDILANIKDNFEVEEAGEERSEEEGGADVEYIVFKGPLGRMKLEFVSRPIVVDKKVICSRRIGSEAKVDYIYSEDEKSTKFKAYKWDDGLDRWAEIDAGMFS